MNADRDEPVRDPAGTSDHGRAVEPPDVSAEWFFEDLHSLAAESRPSADASGARRSRRTRRTPVRLEAVAEVGRRGARPPGRRLEQRLLVVLAGVLVLALALGGAVAAKIHADRQQAVGDARSFEAASSGATPIIAVIGDRTMIGGRNVRPAQRWPVLVQAAVGGEVVELTAPGMGYVAKDASGATYLEQVARIPRSADVVLFLSGDADSGSPRLPILRAATAAYSAAAARAPHARFAVVGPPIVGDTRAPRLTALRVSLRLASETAGVRWVDPLAERWFGDRGADRTSGEGLTQEDQRTMSDRVIDLLRRLGT